MHTNAQRIGYNTYGMQRKRSKWSMINLASVIFFLIAAVFYLVHERNPFLRVQEGEFARVTIVHDGDTVSIVRDRKEEKVRMIGIDAPEMDQKPWGDAAKRHLESLLRKSEWRVTIEYDVEKTDQYGRTLAYVRAKDGTLLNLAMVANGFAVLYTIPPNVKYVEDLRAAQAKAREKRLGIWGEGGLREMPREYREKRPRL